MRALLGTFVAVAVALSVSCAGGRASRRPSALIGKPVDVAAQDLYGREVHVSRGGARVAVVDFWATWCEPCREQLPFLDRLAVAYHPMGVEVYAVSFDEDRSAIEEFLSHTPVSFGVLWDKGGAALAEKLDVTRLPTTLVLDHDGVVRAVHLGYDRTVGEALEAEVRQLLGPMSAATDGR